MRCKHAVCALLASALAALVIAPAWVAAQPAARWDRCAQPLGAALPHSSSAASTAARTPDGADSPCELALEQRRLVASRLRHVAGCDPSAALGALRRPPLRARRIKSPRRLNLLLAQSLSGAVVCERPLEWVLRRGLAEQEGAWVAVGLGDGADANLLAAHRAGARLVHAAGEGDLPASAAPPALLPNARLLEGRARDSLPRLLADKDDVRLSLVLWSPMDAATAREAAEALAPRLAPGCVLVVGGVVNVPWEERFARGNMALSLASLAERAHRYGMELLPLAVMGPEVLEEPLASGDMYDAPEQQEAAFVVVHASAGRGDGDGGGGGGGAQCEAAEGGGSGGDAAQQPLHARRRSLQLRDEPADEAALAADKAAEPLPFEDYHRAWRPESERLRPSKVHIVPDKGGDEGRDGRKAAPPRQGDGGSTLGGLLRTRAAGTDDS